MQQKVLQFVREQRRLIIFVAAMALFRSAIADWNDVPSGSMLPTVQVGDRLLVDKLAYDVRIPFTHLSLYRIADPQPGEIVIFESARADKRLVKRVIGVPGDVVAMRGEALVINGRPVEYTASGNGEWIEALAGHPHAVQLTGYGSPLDSFGPVRVPEGHLLVLGDNRDNSADSRVIGFVPRGEVTGRARRIAFSLDYDHYLMPRGDRFLRRLD